jgi:hypothetical protein
MSKAKSILSKTFIENVKDLGEDQLADMVVKATVKIKQLKEEQNQDDKLNAAKQIVKDLNAGYSSIIKMEEAKVAFLIEEIQAIQEGINPDASV